MIYFDRLDWGTACNLFIKFNAHNIIYAVVSKDLIFHRSWCNFTGNVAILSLGEIYENENFHMPKLTAKMQTIKQPYAWYQSFM